MLGALWNRQLRGDEAEVPVAQREWYREVLEEPDPERQLALNARNGRAVRTRIAGLLGVILWTLHHPDVWQLLVGKRDWAPDAWERWFADTSCAQLLR